MGIYLNPPADGFEDILKDDIYVDKTEKFAEASREAAKAVQQEMAGYLRDKGLI